MGHGSMYHRRPGSMGPQHQHQVEYSKVKITRTYGKPNYYNSKLRSCKSRFR